jgi:hypothetical protein
MPALEMAGVSTEGMVSVALFVTVLTRAFASEGVKQSLKQSLRQSRRRFARQLISRDPPGLAGPSIGELL